MPCIHGHGLAVHGTDICQSNGVEEHPADIQVDQILTVEDSTEFLNEIKIVCPAKKQLGFGILQFDLKSASELPDGGNPGVCCENAKLGEVMIREPSRKTDFQAELFQ